MSDFKRKIQDLRISMSEIISMVDLDELKSEINSLEEESQSPDLWKDGKKGSKLMTILANKKSFYKNIDQLNSSLETYSQLSQEANQEEIYILEKDSKEDIESIESTSSDKVNSILNTASLKSKEYNQASFSIILV